MAAVAQFRPAGFPAPTGFLGEIIEAHERGDLSNEEASRWLLEAAAKCPVDELHEVANSHYATTRQSSITRDDDSRMLLNWMVDFRNVVPSTARQYVRRIQQLGAEAENPGKLIDEITGDPDRWANAEQTLAALKLLVQFRGEQH
jgi:hypothetical protein